MILRYSRTIKGPLYASSTAVVVMEIMKFVACLCVVTYDSGGRLHKCLYEDIICKPAEILKLSVCALMYSIQVALIS